MTLTLTLYENTFISSEDAQKYFDGRLNSDAWDNATEPNKQKALVTASKKINQLDFIGYKKVSTQPMAFPRLFDTSDYYDSLYCTLPPELPQEIPDAVCEEALALLDFGSSVHLKNQKMGIQSVSVGVGSTSYNQNKDLTQLLSVEAYKLVNKWTQKGFNISNPRVTEFD